MIWLYRLCFLPVFLLTLPGYVLRMWRRGGYRKDFGHRFGWLGAVPPRRAGVRRIWLQAVSVGELIAVGPLLERLATDPSVEIFLTTTTSTGRRLAEEKYTQQTAWRGVFPLDWWPCAARAWRRINPDLVILMESEIWPEHLHQAGRRQVPVLVLNARLSDRSFRRYRRLGGVIRPLIRPVSAILAGTEQDCRRFALLQAPGTELETSGNMKLDVVLRPILSEEERVDLRVEIGAQPGDRILLGASTWPGEEAMIASAAASLRQAGRPVRPLIVPRHAERRAELEHALGTKWGSVHFRSRQRQASPESAIYVADTTGELMRFVQIADLVFVGKSMPPHTEGQTPIEAAGLGKAILVGPGTSNFRQIVESLVASGAARRVADTDAFRENARLLLEDDALREQMGRAGSEWARQHRGATAKAIEWVHRYLPPAE